MTRFPSTPGVRPARRSLLAAAGFGPLALLAACSDSRPDAAAGADGSDAGGAQQNVVDWTDTPIRVQDAARVVALDGTGVDVLRELDLEPVGAQAMDTVTAEPYFGKDTACQRIGGTFFEPAVEQILALRPDLVIGAKSVHASLRAALGEIPLFLNAFGSADAGENLTRIARLTGRTAQARTAVQRWERTLAAGTGREPAALVLFGAASAAVLNGLVIAVLTLGAPADVGLLQQYLMGSLAARDWSDLALVAPFALIGLPTALLLGRRLTVLSLGDDVAAALGVRGGPTRTLAMVIGCVLVAATVAVAGPIGFVALLAPHLVRGATGLRAPAAVIALSALTGATMLLGPTPSAACSSIPARSPWGSGARSPADRLSCWPCGGCMPEPRTRRSFRTRRIVALMPALLAATAALAVLALGIGTVALSPTVVVDALLGIAHPADVHIVRERALAGIPPRMLARELAMLPQGPVAPAGLGVRDLVLLGRHPHRGLLARAGRADHEAVDEALALTGTAALADREVQRPSGGERQRVWMALTLAQQARILLLGEPTTFLDLGHQFELLELVAELRAKRRLTVLMVLHDLDQAARFADRIAVVGARRGGTGRANAQDGAGTMLALGEPASVLDEPLLRDVFGIEAELRETADGRPHVVPLRAARSR